MTTLDNLIYLLENNKITINDLLETFMFRYEKIIKIFKVKVNQVQMMYDRNYINHPDTSTDVLDFELSLRDFRKPELIDKMLKIEQFVNIFGETSDLYDNLSTEYIIDNNRNESLNGKRVKILYKVPSDPGGRISNDDIKKDIINIEKTNEDIKYIFINMAVLNPHTKKAIINISKNNDVETFQYNNLLINPINHFLSPKYKILTEEQKKSFLDFLSRKTEPLSIDQLNTMSHQDPVAKYYGVNVGEIFEIENHISVSGLVVQKIIYHRVVKQIDIIFK